MGSSIPAASWNISPSFCKFFFFIQTKKKKNTKTNTKNTTDWQTLNWKSEAQTNAANSTKKRKKKRVLHTESANKTDFREARVGRSGWKEKMKKNQEDFTQLYLACMRLKNMNSIVQTGVHSRRLLANQGKGGEKTNQWGETTHMQGCKSNGDWCKHIIPHAKWTWTNWKEKRGECQRA